MHRPTWTILTACLLLPLVEMHAADPGRPNILFIVGDDMGYADVGFHKCKDIPTPNLDALAASGIRFTSGYVSGTQCVPSRSALMTGRYQQRYGNELNGKNGLPEQETTIANRLKTAGYATGLVGKWHLGSSPEQHPQKRGFDDFFGFLGGAHSYFNAGSILRGTHQVESLDYTTDAFGREAVAFIERHKTTPWFLYLAFNAVHTPMDATKDRLARFASISDKTRRTYGGMMLAMDENIGLVRKKLANSGLDKNTIVVFISDNGGPTMADVTVNGSSNAPLRGSKRTTLEGGIRVPFVVSWPGRLKPGVYEQPVMHFDLTATALAVAGVAVQPEWRLDGVDLLPFLTGSQAGAPHDALYWRHSKQMAIRVGDYKLVRYDINADSETGKPKRQVTGKPNEPVTAAKLYRLSDDIGETKDLMSTMPDKANELQAKWDAWNATLPRPIEDSGADNDGPEP